MNKKQIFLILIIVLFLLCPKAVFSGSSKIKDYNPPFEIYGVVKEIRQDSLDVYIPRINKKINVTVCASTSILNRMEDKKTQHRIDEIRIEDLVIIKGVLKEDHFFGEEISFLTISQN